LFTEIRGQCLSRFADGRHSVLARTGGGANGATLGPDGNVYVANNGGLSAGPDGYWFAPEMINGRIQRVSRQGHVSELVVDFPGVPAPHRPNDLCFGPDGKLYVTDPANWEDGANLRPGRIWRTDLEGSVELLAEVPWFPNGIAFGPDPAFLYVAQSITMKVLEFPWRPEGLGEPREFCTLPRGFPDGFCFSSDGDLYVCGSMGDTVCVFDREGALKEMIEAPEHAEPTNCCLGDDGTLYVTLSGASELVAFDAGADPLPLFGSGR
jgi:gluconolactonase